MHYFIFLVNTCRVSIRNENFTALRNSLGWLRPEGVQLRATLTAATVPTVVTIKELRLLASFAWAAEEAAGAVFL